MLTSNIVPVVGSIVIPIGRIGMLVTVIPCASVATTIVVSVGVSCVILGNVVITGSIYPVMSIVVGVILCVSVLVAAIVFTHIALTVVIVVNVSSLFAGISVTVASKSKPVMGLVV